MVQDGARLSLIGSVCSNAVVADHLTPAGIDRRLVMVETSMGDMGNKIDILLDLVQKKEKVQVIS